MERRPVPEACGARPSPDGRRECFISKKTRKLLEFQPCSLAIDIALQDRSKAGLVETSEVAMELLEKLALIGPKGRAASRDLEAARRHQEHGEPRDAVGRGVSAHIRGALDAVLSYAELLGDFNSWRQVSRTVVRAKDNYDRSIELADGDASKWLDELMGFIEEQREFHENEDSRALKRAVALIVRLKGAEALVVLPIEVVSSGW